MKGITIIETEVLQSLIGTIEDLKQTILEAIAELKEAKKPYLTAQDVMSITGFGKTWVNDNKHLIGFSTPAGRLRFKRSDVIEFMDQNYFKRKPQKLEM